MATERSRGFLGRLRVLSPRVIPPRSAFTTTEWAVVQRHRTPLQVQRFLNGLRYNREQRRETLRSFRRVIATRTAHCLEAAITAAAILEHHGYPPVLLSLESVDLLDHVLFLFQEDGRWGTVARSRDAGLHGRKPVFRSLRDLVVSYAEPYVDFTGRLKGYGVGNLYELGNYDWRFSQKNAWKVERYLLTLTHKKYRMAEHHYSTALLRYQKYRGTHPTDPVRYYDSRPLWLE